MRTSEIGKMDEYENLTNLRPIYIGDVNNPNIEKLIISPCPSITVNVQGLTTITISPSNPTVSIGYTQQFTAICQDQDGNIMTCPTIAWDITDPILGTITPTGLFTAVASSGTVTVTATGDSIVGSATVTFVYSTWTTYIGQPIFNGYRINRIRNNYFRKKEIDIGEIYFQVANNIPYIYNNQSINIDNSNR